MTIIHEVPERKHQRGVVAATAIDGKTTVVLEEGKSLTVNEAQSKNMTDGAHVVMVVHSAGADKKEEVVGSVHSDAIQERLDRFLDRAAEAGITDAASKLESLRNEHSDEVGASTEQTRERAHEDIKDRLEAAISHATEEREREATKGDHAGEGSKGGEGGHGESTKGDGGGDHGDGGKDDDGGDDHGDDGGDDGGDDHGDDDGGGDDGGGH